MTKTDIIKKYHKQIGSFVAGFDSAILDWCSLGDVIDNSRSFSFKVDLFPIQMLESLLDFTDTTTITDLSSLETLLSSRMRWMAFYPKYNVNFEKKMHVPILNLNAISASDEIKTVYQIPIEVTYYIMFNNTVNTLKRYYNSNIVFDHTAYMILPPCITDSYNFNDLFQWTADATIPYTDPTIWNYGVDFTFDDNFTFIIDDMDIYSLRKNIVFFEIRLNGSIQNFDVYLLMKAPSGGTDVFLKKGNGSKLAYRKVFYNTDFINIKNRIVKYSE